VISSILIHEGAANSGHYYAFIYNNRTGKWYKFNDIYVSEVSEEKVLKDAYGDGRSRTNANCLIYHKVGGLISECPYYPNYEDSLDLGYEGSYSALISSFQRDTVHCDNMKFQEDLQEYELN
jgi:ubiquitin carboxyl-terminal hydrolase 25/28